MEIQWGKNPEYTISFWFNIRRWALPFAFWIDYSQQILGHKHNGFSVEFLCFGFEFEIWRWKK